MFRGTGYSRHRWSGPGGPFIPNTDGPGGPLIGGTVSSMTGLLYCPEILPNHIFTNPQVLLDKISELVKIHHDLMCCSGPEQRTEEWQMLFDHTLVTLEPSPKKSLRSAMSNVTSNPKIW